MIVERPRLKIKSYLRFTLCILGIFLIGLWSSWYIAAILCLLLIAFKVTLNLKRIKKKSSYWNSKLACCGDKSSEVVDDSFISGFGKLGNEVFNAHVDVVEDGIIVSHGYSFVPLAFKIDWGKISILNPFYSKGSDAQSMIVRVVFLSDEPREFYIPWKIDFNEFVPSRVGISQAENGEWIYHS